MPRQVKTQAASLREMSPGTLPVVTAIVIMGLYNKKPGRKIDVTHKTFGGTGIVNNAHRTTRPAAPVKRPKATGAMQSKPLEQIGNPVHAPRAMPTAVPNYADTFEHADAVAKMEGRPVAEIALAVGIPERTVRRIQADLGIGAA